MRGQYDFMGSWETLKLKLAGQPLFKLAQTVRWSLVFRFIDFVLCIFILSVDFIYSKRSSLILETQITMTLCGGRTK